MTYQQLISAMETALQPLVEGAGGQFTSAESLEQARSFLSAAPRRWRLILHWEGYGEHPEARMGMITHQVATVIQAPRGLARDASPTLPGPGAEPTFSERIQQVCHWLSALRFPDGTGADHAGFSLAGSQWLETTGNFAAHVLNWRLDAAMPAFSSTIPLSFPHLN